VSLRHKIRNKESEDTT